MTNATEVVEAVKVMGGRVHEGARAGLAAAGRRHHAKSGIGGPCLVKRHPPTSTKYVQLYVQNSPENNFEKHKKTSSTRTCVRWSNVPKVGRRAFASKVFPFGRFGGYFVPRCSGALLSPTAARFMGAVEIPCESDTPNGASSELRERARRGDENYKTRAPSTGAGGRLQAHTRTHVR